MSFSSAFGQKDVKKDAETLLPEDTDAEAALPVRHPSRAWCWCMSLGLALMLSGVVVGGAYLYRYYVMEVSSQPLHGWDDEEDTPVFFCGVHYEEEDFMIREEEEVDFTKEFHLRQLQQTIQILEREQVEVINVPVPEFEDGDPADIVHDFKQRLTAYLDLSLNKCYVIPLNTSVVMPPKDFLELLVNMKSGTYLPQTYLIHEEMVVTERLHHVDQLGDFIYSLCRGKETYKLSRRDHFLGMQKREALNCRKIRHFESELVVQTLICEP